MISNQVLQSTIDGIREISHIDLCIMEADGKAVVMTDRLFDDAAALIPEFAASPADSQAVGQYQYFKIFDDLQLTYILVVLGATDHTLLVGKMAAYQIEGLIEAFKEHYDRDGFMKNLLLDNLLLIDIYERARRLHIAPQQRRVVIVLESLMGRIRDHEVQPVMLEMCGSGDFITQLDENNLVVVREVNGQDESGQIQRFSENALRRIDAAGIQGLRIASGSVVDDLKEISHSYKEAKMALDVSRIFFTDRRIVAYDQLGIGRLIYQLPIPLCRMFIRETFKGKSPDEFDEETLATINKFFENNLNVSETSRQLFIHRNTLVYRLDKLQKSTGLDLRVFEDAITFKIALMVVRYMKYMDQENT